MRLIDADKMEREMCDLVQGDIRSYPYDDGYWDSAFRLIDNQPTVDAVPVVRCCDCKNRQTCMIGFLLNISGEGSDFYCGFGERKEE